jgi:hypothetical protein
MTNLAKSTVAAIKMALDGLEFIHSHLGVGKGSNEKFLQASNELLFLKLFFSSFVCVIILFSPVFLRMLLLS